MKRFLFVFLVVVFVGCDSSGDNDPQVTGRWSGTLVYVGVPVALSLDLSESDGVITGFGTVGSLTAFVEGTHRYPAVSLVISVEGFRDSSFAGTMLGDERTIAGIWTEPGYGGLPLVLRK